MSYSNKFHVRIETKENLTLDEKLNLCLKIKEQLDNIKGVEKIRVTREVTNQEIMDSLKWN